MKVKHFIGALCLPLAFAACSNDDFVNTPSLENRGKVDVTITAQKQSQIALTRMDINGSNKFLWEKDIDMLGAAMVDGTSIGIVNTDNKILVNYPFTAVSSAESSAFNAKSSIAKGMYLFTYPYGDALSREPLDLSVPAQKFDVSSTKSSLQQAVNQMRMVSPIVKLTGGGVSYKDAQSYNLNLEFVNLYKILHVDISAKNIKAGTNPLIQKVTINAGGTGFVKTATAKVTGFPTAAIVEPTGDSKQIAADKLAAAKTAVDALVKDASIYDVTERGASELTVNGDLPVSESATSLYVLVPRGDYSAAGLTVQVVTSEGTYTRLIDASSVLDFSTSSAPLGIKAELNFAQDGTGNVVLPETFSIASTTDWDNAVKFVSDHAVSYLNKSIEYNLTKDIEISSLPVFKVKVMGGKTLTLNSSGKIFSFMESNKDQFEGSNVSLAVAGANTTLSLGANVSGFTKIVNLGGTINLTQNFGTSIDNKEGTLNIQGDVVMSAAISNSASSKGKAATINIVKDKTFTFTTITFNNYSNGTIVNNGTIVGTIINFGTIDNYGVLKAAVTNSGKVIIEKDSKSDNVATITGGTTVVKDITSFVALTDKYKFGSGAVVTTEVSNAKQYADANNATGITDVTLSSGDWTISSAGADDSKTIGVPSTTVKGLTLKGNLILKANLVGKNIAVAGGSNVTISADAVYSISGANVEVQSGASLTVNNNVKVNSLSAADNTYIATVKGNLTVKAGAKMYFAIANVDAGVKLLVEGNNPTVAGSGEFGVKANAFTNSGTVQSAASTATAGKLPGWVSQPKNEESGTFIGNAHSFDFAD